MNSLSSLYVADHLNELRSEAAARRLAKSARGAETQNRLVAAVKNVWSLLSGPADRPAVTPNISTSTFATPFRS